MKIYELKKIMKKYGIGWWKMTSVIKNGITSSSKRYNQFNNSLDFQYDVTFFSCVKTSFK